MHSAFKGGIMIGINFRKALFYQKIKPSFFHLNPEILSKIFSLIYDLILTPILTLTPQLSPNPNRKPHI